MAEETLQASRCLPDTAVCLQCGYSLRMLPDNRCPECGRAFDPRSPATWRDAKRGSLLDQILAVWAQPPEWLEVGLVTGSAAVLLVYFSVQVVSGAPPHLPRFDRRGLLDLLPMSVWVVGPIYCWRVLARLFAMLAGKRPPRARRYGRVRWLLVPLSSAFVIGVIGP